MPAGLVPMSHSGRLPGLPHMTTSSNAAASSSTASSNIASSKAASSNTAGSASVLLAGATGVFGSHITRVLTDAGYDVIGIGRGAGNTLRADLNDREQVLSAVRGRHADVVIHAATALKRPPARHRDMTATDTLRTVGMRNLVEAARQVGASRFINESMIFGYGYGQHGARVLTEADPFAPPQADASLEAHVAAMRTKEELTSSIPGIDGVSLRFGLFYGPGATETILSALRKRALPAPRSHGRVLPWVHLEDAAFAVLTAIEHGRPGEAYNIVDDEPIGFGDHIRATASAFGTPAPLALPAWVLSPMRLLAAMLKTDLRLSNEKARTELGWTPHYPNAVAGLAEMAADMAAGTATGIAAGDAAAEDAAIGDGAIGDAAAEDMTTARSRQPHVAR